MKTFLLVLALVAGALSLVTTFGMLRAEGMGRGLATAGWVLSFAFAGLALYALRTAMRQRDDRSSMADEEARLRTKLRLDELRTRMKGP